MEPLTARLAHRYVPTVSFESSLDCDAVVRTTTGAAATRDLLNAALESASSDGKSPSVVLISPDEAPPLVVNATRALEDALRGASSGDAAITAFAAAVEGITTVEPYTYLRKPALLLRAMWAGESTLDPPSDESTQILLFVRDASRHDEAALLQTLPRTVAAVGDANVHVVRLAAQGTTACDEDSIGQDIHAERRISAIAKRIVKIALAAAMERADTAIAAAERARRAARPSFRTWFSGSAHTPSPLLQPIDTVTSTSPRRASFSLALRTPQFDPASVEGLARRSADFSLVTGRYTEAASAYGQLATDCRALTGISAVHEASALEMLAVARVLSSAPSTSIISPFDRAVTGYARASRPELSVRAALRAVHFCNDIKSYDTAGALLLRVRDAIAPSVAPSVAPTGNVFVDSALAVLAAASFFASNRLKYSRRASFYAFVAMTRFTTLQYSHLATRLADGIDYGALSRRAVAQHVALTRAIAAVDDGQVLKAINHFASLFASMTDSTDIELQSTAVRAFLSTAAKDAMNAVPNIWNSGACFPLVSVSDARVVTLDTSNDDPAWIALENDVLEDRSYFRALRTDKGCPPKRVRRVENSIADLRKHSGRQKSKSASGSTEAKIRRLQDSAAKRIKTLRDQSLLEHGAVVGEHIFIKVTLTNPLQFPLFIDCISPVVSLNGSIYSNVDSDTSNGNTDEKEPDVKFFPVNGVTLAPCSSQCVSTHIIVCKSGALRFIGVTWIFTIGMGSASPRASSAVPGYCTLEKRGRRLNKTRKQRASEPPMYEEDFSLSVEVVEKAPRLSTKLLFQVGDSWREVDDAENVLLMRAGELREARLVITNEGDAAVDDIVLRVGTPHLIFVDIDTCKVLNNGNPIFCKIDMDDSVAKQSDVFVAAAAQLNIAAKSCREINVWLRASVPSTAFTNTTKGRKTKRERVSTETFDISEDGVVTCQSRAILAYGDEHARVCRVGVTLKIRRSITASPRFMRETNTKALFGDHGANLYGVLLGVEIEHSGRGTNDNVKFDITEIDVTSQGGWRPMPLPSADEPTGKLDGEVAPSPFTLLINETATVFTLILREKGSDSSNNGVNGADEMNQNCSFSYTDEKLGWHTESQQLSGGTALRAESEARASTHFVLCERYSGHSSDQKKENWAFVSVRWQAGDGTTGDMHVPALDPERWVKQDLNYNDNAFGGIDSNRENATNVDMLDGLSGDPVSIKIEHVSEIEHDFLEDPLSRVASARVTKTSIDGRVGVAFPAVIDVRVGICNVSTVLLDVLVTAPPVGGVADGDRGRHWAGDVAVSLRSLPPGAERWITLVAVVPTPGNYNVSRFSVIIQRAGFHAVRARRAVRIPSAFVNVRAKNPVMASSLSSPQLAIDTDSHSQSFDANIVDAGASKPTQSSSSISPKSSSSSSLLQMTADDASEELSSSKEKGAVCNGNAEQRPLTASRPDYIERKSDAKAVKLVAQSADDVLWDDADTEDES